MTKPAPTHGSCEGGGLVPTHVLTDVGRLADHGPHRLHQGIDGNHADRRHQVHQDQLVGTKLRDTLQRGRTVSQSAPAKQTHKQTNKQTKTTTKTANSRILYKVGAQSVILFPPENDNLVEFYILSGSPGSSLANHGIHAFFENRLDVTISLH